MSGEARVGTQDARGESIPPPSWLAKVGASKIHSIFDDLSFKLTLYCRVAYVGVLRSYHLDTINVELTVWYDHASGRDGAPGRGGGREI